MGWIRDPVKTYLSRVQGIEKVPDPGSATLVGECWDATQDAAVVTHTL
jgi:hypothetical protein